MSMRIALKPSWATGPRTSIAGSTGISNAEGFADFLRRGFRPGYDPYAHRRHRHCREALEEARREFEGAYAPELIDAVVERHIRDDYDGYFPYREDFEKGDFREKYHEGGSPAQSDSSLPDPDDLAAYFRGKHYETMARSTRRRGIPFPLAIHPAGHHRHGAASGLTLYRHRSPLQGKICSILKKR